MPKSKGSTLNFKTHVTSDGFFWCVAVAITAVNLLLWFPGALNNDSVGQYAEAQSQKYTDWHPPIMAVLWSLFAPIARSQWPLFVLNLGLYWLGFALIGHAILRLGRPYLAYLVLFSGASPLFLFFNRMIITDVGLASALIAVFGCVFWLRTQNRKWGIAAYVLIPLVLGYAILVRTNSVFAAAPIIFYAAGFRPRPLNVRWWIFSTALAALLLLVATPFNRSVLGAANSGAMQRLQIYDIAGIAYHSGDTSQLRAAAGRVPQPVGQCYTPLFWDTLLTARCGFLWSSLPPPGSAERGAITSIWLKSIVAHPLSYASHRLRHFNAELLFLVPAAVHCVSAPEIHACGNWTDAKPDHSVIRNDYVLKNVLVWPISWCVLGLAVAFLLRRKAATETVSGANLLLLSSLIYAAAYLAVGLAVNVRYFFWTMMGVQIAVLLAFVDEPLPWRKQKIMVIVGPLVVTGILGYISRVFDVRIFFDG